MSFLSLEMRSWHRALAKIAFFAFSLVNPATAHPIHTSYAEVDFRPALGKLEIALRLFTDDMEAVLSKRTGRKVTLASASTPEIEALLQDYLRETFVVKPPGRGAAWLLKVVGRELKEKGQYLWVFLECPWSGDSEGVRVEHRVLRDLFPDQLNSILVRDHSVTPVRQFTLVFVTPAEQTILFRR